MKVLLGSASEKCTDLINSAHDTQHEKIIRGIAIGLALIMYGREEEADALISQLTTDKDPILRYGGMFTIGLAYCGTANNNVIKYLLLFSSLLFSLSLSLITVHLFSSFNNVLN
jgi:26S proteasome regulatory subunit N2